MDKAKRDSIYQDEYVNRDKDLAHGLMTWALREAKDMKGHEE